MKFLIICLASFQVLAAQQNTDPQLETELKRLKKENKYYKATLSQIKKVQELKSKNKALELELECRKENLEACNQYGVYLYSNKKRSQALPFWKKACEKMLFESCYYLGRYYDKKKNMKKAISYYGKSCDGDYFIACNNLGVIYMQKSKPTIGVKYLESACQNTYKAACLNIGKYYVSQKNEVEAVFWFKQSCENKIDVACKMLKSYQARHAKLCERGNSVGCVVVGNMKVRIGEEDKALEFYEKACKLNEAVGCFNKGVVHYSKGQKKNALGAWGMSCNKKDQWSCFLVVALKEEDKLFNRFENRYSKLCNQNLKESCYQLAVAYSLKKDFIKSYELLQKSKTLGFTSWAKEKTNILLKNLESSKFQKEFRELKASIVFD